MVRDEEAQTPNQLVMTEAPSGLIVPREYALKHEAWEVDFFKRVRRVAMPMLGRGVQILLVCNTCRAAKRNPEITQSEDSLGRVVWSCACTERVFRV